MASISDTRFKYKPLPGGDFFRLLSILPSPDEAAPIECSLMHERTLHAPRYEALSYTWGDGPEDYSIVLDRNNVGVRKNLYDALLRLRLSDRPRLLTPKKSSSGWGWRTITAAMPSNSFPRSCVSLRKTAGSKTTMA
jgi:hypothetical protein